MIDICFKLNFHQLARIYFKVIAILVSLILGDDGSVVLVVGGGGGRRVVVCGVEVLAACCLGVRCGPAPVVMLLSLARRPPDTRHQTPDQDASDAKELLPTSDWAKMCIVKKFIFYI